MRVAVVGAGIAGLVAAVGLQRDGHRVTLFEQRSDLRPLGAGLTLFANAFAALDAVGLGDAVRGVSSDEIASMRAGQRTPSGRWLLTVPKAAVASLRSTHRAELHRVLSNALEPGTLRLGTRAVALPDGSPEIAPDGQPGERFDLVIAADGIRSASRAELGLDTGLRYAGCTAWRGVTARPVDIRGEAGESWGRGSLFGIVPLPDRRVYWFATMNTPAGTVFSDERAELLNRFHGWHDPVRELIEATPAPRILRHDIYDLARPLSSFVQGRTVLLGDAAHAMTPNLGQGAGQGIEDAATLSLLLRGTSPAQLDATLARYDELRRKRTAAVLLRSRSAGRIAQASHPVGVGLRNAALRVIPGGVMGAVSARVQQWSGP